MYLYQITNLINGKIYIGQTNNITKRWSNHKSCNSPNTVIAKAIQKYGVENFKFEILYRNEKDYVGEKGKQAKALQEKIVKFGKIMNKRDTDEEEKALISLFPLEIKFIINQLMDFINIHYPTKDYFEELREETEKRKNENEEV